jgi:hypothetical protein
VQGSIHKKLIFAGFGCVGAVVVLMVIALLLVPRPEFNQPRDPALYTPGQALAARDSLEVLRARFAAPRERSTNLRYGPLWKTALMVMRMERPLGGFRALPYGDTFPAGSDARREWMEAADWRAVSVLLGRAAGHGERPDAVDSVRILNQTDANMLVSIARALHARARRLLSPPLQLVEAARAEREVIAIGRGLENEPDLAHVIVGVRIVRDALKFLSSAPSLDGRVVRDPGARWLVPTPTSTSCGVRGGGCPPPGRSSMACPPSSRGRGTRHSCPRFGSKPCRRFPTDGCSALASRRMASAPSEGASSPRSPQSIFLPPSRPACGRDSRFSDSAWRNDLPAPSNTAPNGTRPRVSDAR